MSPGWAALCGLFAFGVLLLRDVLTDLIKSEVRTRLFQLPNALMRIAVYSLPHDLRTGLGGEWRSELEAISRDNEKTPLTCLIRAIFYAFGLLVHGPARSATNALASFGRSTTVQVG